METNKEFSPWKHKKSDLYQSYLDDIPTLRQAQASLIRELRPLPTWTRLMNEINYGPFWRGLSLIPFLKTLRLEVPMLLATGWWDAEDFWGGIAPWDFLPTANIQLGTQS